MLALHKLLRYALASLACIAINAAHAEVASVYGGSDGFCGSRTANGERVNCSAMTAAHRTLPFGTRVTVCHNGCVVVRDQRSRTFRARQAYRFDASYCTRNRARSDRLRFAPTLKPRYLPKLGFQFLARKQAPHPCDRADADDPTLIEPIELAAA
jgi:hypothetical protein